jgi:hypothetical protein
MFYWTIEFQGSCSRDLNLGQSKILFLESAIDWLSLDVLLVQSTVNRLSVDASFLHN